MKLLFLTNNLPFSVIIRGFTSCEWSHCAVAFGDVVIEARFGGVTQTTLDEFKSRGKYAIVDVPLENETDALEYAKSRLGNKYDFKGILGFWFNRDLESPVKDYCSELAANVSNAGGVKLVRDGLKGVSPRDLFTLPLE